MPKPLYRDRRAAGERLGQRLCHLRSDNLVVVGLPRGGVPVAFEVAHALSAPLDVLVVRKLGVPAQPELAMGAIGEHGVIVVNDDVVRATQVTATEIADTEQRERAELARRTSRYRVGRHPVALDGRVVLIVDDGIATGATARAACRVARAQGARRVFLAVPAAPIDVVKSLRNEADKIVIAYPIKSSLFLGVGQFYRDFAATSDDEVATLLAASASASAVETIAPDGDARRARG